MERQNDALASEIYEVYEVGQPRFNGTVKNLLDAIRPKLALIVMGPHDRVGTYTAWAFGHPRAAASTRRYHRATRARVVVGTAAQAGSVQVASGVKRFNDHQLTAPIFATGWDGNVRVSLFADGRIGVKTETPAYAMPPNGNVA